MFAFGLCFWRFAKWILAKKYLRCSLCCACKIVWCVALKFTFTSLPFVVDFQVLQLHCKPMDSKFVWRIPLSHVPWPLPFPAWYVSIPLEQRPLSFSLHTFRAVYCKDGVCLLVFMILMRITVSLSNSTCGLWFICYILWPVYMPTQRDIISCSFGNATDMPWPSAFSTPWNFDGNSLLNHELNGFV